MLKTLLLSTTAIILSACSTIYTVPPGAPVRILQPTVTHNPAILQHGQFVQVKGDVTLHPGQTVVTLPATH